MDVSVITPSMNMLDYLERCHASVADQKGATFEHIVVDGGSTDGTPEWLQATSDVAAIVEPDNGMYDAINKGFRLARGEILAYLNCDEQYLPGVLALVKQYFDAHPEVDALAGDTLLIRPDGTLISFRKSYPLPLWIIMGGHIHIQTSSLFLRRRIVDNGDYFEARLKDVGDHELVVRLMRKGYRFGYCGAYLSAFTMTGSNRGLEPNVVREFRQLQAENPRWMAMLAAPLKVARWVFKLVRGAYFQRMPIEYAVFSSSDTRVRRVFVAYKADFRWRSEA